MVSRVIVGVSVVVHGVTLVANLSALCLPFPTFAHVPGKVDVLDCKEHRASSRLEEGAGESETERGGE